MSSYYGDVPGSVGSWVGGGFNPASPPTRRIRPALLPGEGGGAGGSDPYPGYMSPEEERAEATRRAYTAYGPTIGLYQHQLARESLANMAQQAGLARLYDVLGGSMAGFSGQVADIYNTAAQGLSSFDSGYSHGADLARQSLQQQGAAYAGSFGALPAISGQQGGVKFLTALQQGKEEEAKINDLIAATAAKIPGAVEDYLSDIEASQGKLQGQYLTYQQKEADRALRTGEKNRAYAWSVADRFTKASDYFYVAQPGKGGTWTIVDSGPKYEKPGKQATLRIVRAADGSQWAVDPYTGKRVTQITGPGAPKPTKPYRFTHGGYNYTVDPTTGVASLTPGQAPLPAKPAKGIPTGNQLVKMVQGWYTGVQETRVKNIGTKDEPVYRKVPTGAQTGTKDYQPALRALTALKVPKAQALDVLDTYFERGERGRPWLNATERSALQQAKVHAAARYLTSRQVDWANAAVKRWYPGQAHKFAITDLPGGRQTAGYLSEDQARALNQAGLLPGGVWLPASVLGRPTRTQADRVYLIAA